MKVMLRFVLFSGWLMFRATAHSQDTGTRYGLKMLSLLGYKTEASK